MLLKLNSVTAIVTIFALIFSSYDDVQVKCNTNKGDKDNGEKHKLEDTKDKGYGDDDEVDNQDDGETEANGGNTNIQPKSTMNKKAKAKDITPSSFGKSDGLEEKLEQLDIEEDVENRQEGLDDDDECQQKNKYIPSLKEQTPEECLLDVEKPSYPVEKHHAKSLCEGEMTIKECGQRVKQANIHTFASIIKALKCEINRIEKSLGKESVNLKSIDTSNEYDIRMVGRKELKSLPPDAIRAKLKRFLMFYYTQKKSYKRESKIQNSKPVDQLGEEYLQSGKSFERSLRANVKQMIKYSSDCELLLKRYSELESKSEPPECQLDEYVLRRIRGELYPSSKIEKPKAKC